MLASTIQFTNTPHRTRPTPRHLAPPPPRTPPPASNGRKDPTGDRDRYAERADPRTRTTPPQRRPVSWGPNSVPPEPVRSPGPAIVTEPRNTSASAAKGSMTFPPMSNTPHHEPGVTGAWPRRDPLQARLGQELLRKEVIQPHLPVRLPCYDFVPIASPTFDHSLPENRVRPRASGVTDFRDVTGGVYKARERIHRSVADLRLLATPTSRGRVADPDPN